MPLLIWEVSNDAWAYLSQGLASKHMKIMTLHTLYVLLPAQRNIRKFKQVEHYKNKKLATTHANIFNGT